MSIAVAVRKQHSIVIAADSQENFGDRKVDRANHRATKILRAGTAYIATTGWGLYDNILEDYLARTAAPRLRRREDVFAFFMRLWKQLRDRYSLVNDQPHHDHEASPFADVDASFLVVNPAGIFHVASNLSVTEFHEYYAVGSGASYALGALQVLYGEHDAETLARRACAAAMAFDVFCGGDVDVYRIAAQARRRTARRR
jgi:ATP-dependent protease HslVU (ClpYQ) peptidase subunit